MMGYFKQGSVIDVHQPLGEKDNWVTDQPLTFISTKLMLEITVPAGFTTDFASVPWFFRRLYPKVGQYNAAAIIHDFLCRCDSIPRKDADTVFLEAMSVLGVPAMTRHPMYAAVRVGALWHKPDLLILSCKDGKITVIR